jgi:signal transduction histidine kinase
VWTIKGITARYAAHTLDNPTEGAFEPDSEYRSGFLPHALVILATMLLLVQLGDPEPRRALPLIFSTGSLVLLLIVRQAVELREQSRLQQAQRVDAEWHGALLRDAYDFVLVVDPSGRTLHATPMAERMLGGAPVLARPWGLLDIGHPEDRAGLSAAVDAGAASPTEVRFRVRTTPTEDWRELMLRVTDRRRDPAVGAVVLSGHDVTRESRLSGRLQKGADLEALGVFAGGLAHDLNNILTVIDAHAEMLLDDVPAAHPVREDLIGVRRASARARRLTRGLLSLSRSKGAAPGVIDVAGLLASRIDAAQLVDTVSVRSGAAAPSVRVDRHSLTLAIDALLLTILEADPAIEHATFAVGTGRFDETEAAELGIAVGPHVVLSLDGALPAWPAPGVGTALGGVDDSLPMLMAHAAVRECGGTLRTLSSGRITLHLPTGGAV